MYLLSTSFHLALNPSARLSVTGNERESEREKDVYGARKEGEKSNNNKGLML